MAKKKPTKFEDKNDNSSQSNPAETTTPDGTLSSVDKQNIVSQAIREIQFARRYKQGKIRNWQKNEELYYGKKITVTEARSNIDLGRMQEHVHSIMAQIDDPLMFKFIKRKDSQYKKVLRLNAMRSWDSGVDFWDMKDIAMKKQCLIYGRAAAVYYADSINGYKPHLEPIDIYDLLVDPDGGGLDVEQMLYWGRYGVVKSKEELQAMYDSETDSDIKQSIKDLIDGSGNNTESSQEQTNKYVRSYGQNTIGQKALQTDEKYKFWQWFTTYKGVRYVMTLQATAGRAISMQPLSDVFKSNLWPLWTYAAFVDLTEFWTPSYCDYVREIFMNQNITINQMNDNAEAINKPMKVVNVTMIESLAELKYRRDGIIKTKGDYDANRVIQVIATPSIQTPMLVYDKLEQIVEKASGVTETEKGTEDADGAVEIYKGNRKASAGRYGLLNKSYTFGYNRFAILYQWGIKEHLIKKVAIDIIGPEGISTEEIKRTDIFRSSDNVCSCFRVMVESSNAEKLADADKEQAKIDMLTAQAEMELQATTKVMNPQKAFEIKAKIAGFKDEEIRELMDINDYGDEELLAEAAEDLETVLDGEVIPPNQNADNSYKQYFVDFMKDHGNDLKPDQQTALINYVKSLAPVIMKNMASNLMGEKTDMMTKLSNGMLAGATAAPPSPAGGAPVASAPINNGQPQQ